MFKIMRVCFSFSLFVTSFVLVGPVVAQTPEEDREEALLQEIEENEGAVLEEVIVMGVRSSLADALVLKRESDLVVETISSDTIGQLPDVTIAESEITGAMRAHARKVERVPLPEAPKRLDFATPCLTIAMHIVAIRTDTPPDCTTWRKGAMVGCP